MRTRNMILIVLGTKLLLLGLVLSTPTLLPGFEHPWFWSGAPGTDVAQPVQLPMQNFLTWDAYHYVRLAEEGYTKGKISSAFYPLWPSLIKSVSVLTGLPAVWVAVALANILSLAAFALLHFWLTRAGPSVRADWTLLFAVAFPGSLFLMFAYSESLFLFLAIVCLYGLDQKNEKLAAVAAFCLPLTRGLGVLLLLPIVYHLSRKIAAGEKIELSGVFLLASVPLGAAAYFVWMSVVLGDPLAGWKAQQLFAFPEQYQRSFSAIFDPSRLLSNFVDVVGFHNYFNSFLDRALFVGFLIALPIMWRVNRMYFWFSLGLGLLPVMTGSFMSYTRYVAVIFPLFYVLARVIEHARWIQLRAVILMIFGLMQVAFVVRHSVHFWVG